MGRILFTEIKGDDALSRLREALSYMRNHPGTTLTIPPGVYILSDENARRYQESVMRGDLGDNPHLRMFNRQAEYISGLDFTGIKDARIEAAGVTFLIDGFMEPISLQHCVNVEILGLTLDMRRRAYSRGVITGCTQSFFDVLFDDQEFISEYMPAPRIIIVDPRFGRITGVLNADVVSSAVKEMPVRNTVRFFRKIDPSLVGNIAYILHTWHSRPAILIYEARDIKLTDFRIHSHPGMGVVGHRSHNITCKRLMVIPAVNEYVSTNTDATHFASCTGEVRLEGCFFNGHGDDAINIHGYYQTILAEEGTKYRIGVKTRCGTHSQKLDHPDVGDMLAYCPKSTLQQIGEYSAVDVENDPDKDECIVTLDRKLPEGCIGQYLTNLTKVASLKFIDCHVRNHLARGMVIRTDNALVEGCCFENSILSAIHISSEVFWHESAASHNVVIRNNRMIRCGEINGRMCDRVGGVQVYVGAEEKGFPIHENISIENNIIDCPNSEYSIEVYGVRTLNITGNMINRPIQYEKCEKPNVINNCFLPDNS